VKSATRLLLLIVGVVIFLAVSGAFYIVPETGQAILTQFGEPVGAPVTQAGLKVKLPFVQETHRFEKRVLEWDGPSAEMPTRDKLYIVIDAFGRWRIKDPLQFFLRLRDVESAQSRITGILGSEMRTTIARHDLVEVVRTTKARKAVVDQDLEATTPAVGLPPIRLGRVALEDEILDAAKGKLEEFGIELLDLRFKRINYKADVAVKIFDRMISERRQIAERFRSEGAGEAAKILGNKERDLKQIESEAYRQTQVIHGKADAEATTIYAKAYNANPQAREFYEFLRAMETYKTSFARDTTTVLTTDVGLLRFLKGASPAAAPAPAPPAAPAPPRQPTAPSAPPPTPPVPPASQAPPVPPVPSTPQ